MSDIDILIQFLSSTLPQALLAKAAILIPVVGALVSLLIKAPAARARKKWLGPVLALLFGQIAGQVTVGFAAGQWLLGAGLGLFIGLSTVGAHSSSKNGSEALRSTKRGNDSINVSYPGAPDDRRGSAVHKRPSRIPPDVK